METVEKIAQKRMCVSCGTCSAVCPVRAIEMQYDNKRSSFFPVIHNSCIQCGKCLKVCPMSRIEKPKPQLNFLEASNLKTTDFSLYQKSSSGGVTTQILVYLLEQKRVDAVLVVQTKGLEIKGSLVYDSEILKENIGSKYQPVALNEALMNLKSNEKIAVVGLPCHLKGIVNLIREKKIKEEQIVLKIGIICTIGRSRFGIESVLKHYHAPKSIDELSYRYGTDNGKQKLIVNQKEICSYQDSLSHLDYFFLLRGCLFCNDLFNVNADITVGDPWGLETAKTTMSILRTPKGVSIIEEMLQKDLLEKTRDLTEEEVLKTQQNGYDYKIKNFESRVSQYQSYLRKLPLLSNEISEKGKKDFYFQMLFWNSWFYQTPFGKFFRGVVPNKVLIKIRNRMLNRIHK